MSDLSIVYCRGYIVTPLVEACHQRGLFRLLDTREFRDRARLIEALKANAGYLTIALEALESLGWLEKNIDDAYRLTGKADGCLERGLTPFYAMEPEELLADDSRTHTLREKIELLFARSDVAKSALPEPAQGAIVVPLVVYLQRLGTDDVAAALERAGPDLSQTIVELFTRQHWLRAGTAKLTVSGKALLQQSAFQVAASYRPALQAIPALLFGDHARALREIRDGGMSQSLRRTALSHENVSADLQREIVEIFDREPLKKQPRAIVDLNWAPQRPGVSSQEEVRHLRASVDSFLEVDAEQPVNGALAVLAADQPAHYLDRQGRLLDAPKVLSGWQRYLRALAQRVGTSRLQILEEHSARPRLVAEQQHSERLHVEWIHRLLHEPLVSAEAFIILAASVGLFNDDSVRRYQRPSDRSRISLHRLTRRDYIVRHATEDDLVRLCELEKVCWQHTQTPPTQILARVQTYPQGQFVLAKDGKVLGVIYSQRITTTDALMTCTAADVHRLQDESGSIIQLLAVNIDPQAQNASYGDQLLEFMLQRCSLMAAIKQVVGVTLCKKYNAAGEQSFEEYIRQQGSSQDPVLLFHYVHGAEVVKVIPGYRPQDHANRNNGVLVVYDILNRPQRRWGPEAEEPSSTTADAGITRNDRQQITHFVQGEAAQLLNIGESELDIDRPLIEMGLDSADLLKLQGLCEERFGLQLQVGFFFEYSNIRRVIAYLATRFAAPPEEEGHSTLVSQTDARQRPSGPAPPSGDDRADARPIAKTDIAIVGMSCKLPGGIDTPDQLWRVLASNECVIGSFPRMRRNWPTAADYPAIDQGGFVEDVEAFDAGFFRISPAEAQITDPQQRMLLQLAWACLEDAGILPSELKGSNTGVFVGASNADYSRLINEAGVEIEGHHGVGSALAILANRISYFFDFSGPSLLIDTACSSSLVALHTAIQSLRSGECATALVGGANLICHPNLSIAYHKAGMLARDGRCKVFDAKADGYVRSEGAVVFLLKPLHAAVTDRNQIHAVIRGTATNHGGLAGALTVPNPQKQKELLIAAWKDAGINSQDLSYIEAHGTGTAIGDPIEIQGIQAAYAELCSDEPAKPCGIGSVKSNLGHLESAAGVAGLLKIILSFRHKQLPASVNFSQLNPKIRLEDTSLFIQDRLSDWHTQPPRLAAVSSFGSGGTNAHVVVQEYPPHVCGDYRDDHYLFVLSAATHDRLRVYVSEVITWLEREASGARFSDAIFTWQVGRASMQNRLAIKVADHLDLLNKLGRWYAGETNVPDAWSGQVVHKWSSINRVWQTKSGRQMIDHASDEKELELLGTLWASGVEIDWRKCHKGACSEEPKPQTISLPTYPFAKERYWIDGAASKRAAGGNAPLVPTTGVFHPLLHPLLHINSSNLSQQSYSATFSGDEFFLSDHQVRVDGQTIQKILPGVAYLEMARAAIDQALPGRPESTILELRNTAWVQPIVVTGKKQVSIALLADANDQIDFEFYSLDAEREIIHCQGHAILSDQPPPAPLDVEQLRVRMVQNRLEPVSVYIECTRKGLVYGPSFQGLTAIYQGSDEFLAYLRLPRTVEDTSEDYVLHPSLMDGALQAAFLLIENGADSDQPRLPFALESLRIVSPSTREMVAWVRFAPGSQAGDSLVKLDIDLCDERGNICAEMHGLSLREPGKEAAPVAVQARATECLLAAPVWQASGVQAINIEYTAHHVVLCELSKVDVDQLHSLLSLSQCLSLHLGPQETIAQLYSEYALACFERIQAILQDKPQGKVLIQIVVADHQEQAVLAGLSGLLKTATLENPQVVGQLILVGPQTAAEELARQLGEEKTHGLDTLVRYEQGVRQIWRWQEVRSGADKPLVEFKNHGVYLITGGLGGLGVLFAKEILDHTRLARVVLTGRSGLSSEKQVLLDGLSSQAGRVSYRPVNLADLDQVKRLITAIRDEYQQLNGILHSAGMIADDFILNKARTQFAEVLTPKVAGTYNLDKASEGMDLDFVVLFSSIVGAMGNVGQADYAAANGFMDHFAAYRNRLVAAKQRRGRTRAVNWPLWEAGGMSMDPASRERLQEATGLQPMQTTTGMHAFYRCLALPYDQLLVMDGDSAQIRRALLSGPSFRAEPQAEQPMAASETDKKAFPERTQEYLRKQFAAVLKLPSHKIDSQAALKEYGIDSILAMQLLNKLEQTFGSLSKTLLFEYQSISELAEYFGAHHSARLNALFAATANRSSEVTPVAGPPRAQVSRTPLSRRRFIHERNAAPSLATESDPIAIIGLSGRYPEAVDIDAYWNNLRDGKDCIIEVPKERWDWHAYFADDRSKTGHHYSKWGGFIEGVDEFDPLFFSISPREAQFMDPQERLFLQHAWMCVEDAGYTRASLQVPYEQELAGQVGVYVGVMWSEYQLLGAQSSIPDRKMGFAGNVASIANRVSYVLNLHGPSVTLDTMCSSALSAVHFACQDLKLGRTSMAIAGGVNVSVHPNKYLMLSVGQFISSDGHCQSFGEGGDGYIPSEGVGAVVLKRLSDAKRDGDHIYGIIRSSALNHGGNTNGYTVPNPHAQASAISRALAESRTDARHISYVEAHGTGTRLGDPIEIAALSKAFGQYTQDTEFCLIGSAKSNIGHCESAAGIAGLTKVLLQMQHQQIVPSLHSAQLNPYIDFPKSPFIVNQSLRPWEQPVIDGRTLPRIAGISSFGAGGSNAHVILEEYQPPLHRPDGSVVVVIPLSARTPEQLHEKARDLLEFVLARRNAMDLVAMAYTLQVGREPMEERLGFIVSAVEQLTEKLQAYLAGAEDIDDAYRGQVKRNKEALSLFSADDLQLTIDRWIADRKLSRLAELWVRGISLDWNKLYGETKPHRISLPAYPFARERYWIDVAASERAANGAGSAVLHPLLHSNTSVLNGQRYSSTFTGEESFLTDHQVAANGQPAQKVLPAVAYLEMVRAAIAHASPAHPESTVLELRNTVWAHPIVVTDKTQVSIALAMVDDQIDYEIYSENGDDEVIYCQGCAAFSSRSGPPKLDLDQLEGQMGQGRVEPDSVYAACARMGLIYGPTLRGITAIQLGTGQLLARLRLPGAVAGTSGDYVLHPSLMDGALQASVALIDDLSDQPQVPFALDSLLIVSPCATEMVAWVRYSPGSHNVVKLDIDLCDEHGNVCVQMHGLSLRVLSNEIRTGSLVAIPVWQASTAATNNIEFTEHHVLSLQAEQDKTIAQRYTEQALTCFERIQTILQGRRQGKVLVQVVVHDDHEQMLLAGLSGLLKTAALENPQFVGQIIVVSAHTTSEEVTRYLREEKNLGLHPLVRYVQGERLVLLWQEVPADSAKPPVAFEDLGVYLITGGLGGLGILFAKEILEQTPKARVVLTGRSPLSAEKQALLEGLSVDRLTYRQVGLADLDQVRRLIAGIHDEHGQLNGILHSAGMTMDNFILKKTSVEFSDVLTPKVTGTFNLDQATRDIELDFFVLFSSFAGAMGNAGQADYATANGFLDQFAAYRNRQVASKQRHGRTRSINWPLWQAGGMGIEQASLELLRQTTGMHPMQTATGMQAFHRSLALPYDQILVVEGELTQMRRALAAGPPKAVSRSVTSGAATAEIDSGSLLEKTDEYFQRQFSDLLKLPAHKIDPEAALEEYGIDSVLAMQLINRLESAFGSLSKTLFFEYQTVRELSRYFIANHLTKLAALFKPTAVPVVASPLPPVKTKQISSRRFSRLRNAAPTSATESEPIAIIGLSGRYPEAIDIDSYWHNLREGKDCIIEVPEERWDWKAYFSDDRSEKGRHYSKWGGFIAGVDEFDPLFFNIAPKEAKYIDPQERLFLQHAWMAIEDAGYNRANLQVPDEQDLAGQVGVYVGVMWSEYHLYGVEASAEDLGMGFAGSLASIANRVSFALNLHGPSMTLDTMCSSSLTAIHLACQDLKQGRTSLAIAGGVNVSVHPNKYLVLSAGQFISSDGHCQSFGEGGDGYIPGEGVGVVVLKRLSEAKRDRDNIYGLIRGSALNHGGRTNGYTVPNPQAQASAISRALAESRTDARHISYIEAHGTGTKLGDPIEIAALSKAFDQYTKDSEFCLIGSAKSNIGHCESAAGIAGLTKVLLQMQHQQIAPSLHSALLNPHIDFGKSPFIVNQVLRPWEQPVIDGRKLSRIAGISSFGAGGSNAHIIVEEYQRPVQQPMAVVNVVILLSARTAAQLQQKARDLWDFVRQRLSTIDLDSIAYTLQVGREAMEERLGFVASSVEQLAEKLEAYVAGQENIEDVYHGQVKRNKEALSAFSVDADLQQTVDKWIANRKLARLLDMWVKGVELDWSKLYGEARPQRISLPTYPFAKERHWIDTAPSRQGGGTGPTAVLHPLLHSNTSNLSEQRFRSTFSGEEFFMAELAGRKVLPAVACLEMARAAIEQALPGRAESTLLELRDTVWAQPIVVTGSTEVTIALSSDDNEQIDYEIYSGDADQEIVHCQGRATLSHEPAPARLDIERLKAQGQRLLQLQADDPGDYVLHPTLMDSALKAAVALIDGSAHALELLRIISPCTQEMVAWVRNSPDSQTADAIVRFDIDLCDDCGNVAVQMRGLSWQQALLARVKPVIAESAPQVAPVLTRREIAFLAHAQPIVMPVERKKPAAITLTTPVTSASSASSTRRAGITLSNVSLSPPAQWSPTPIVSPVRLYDCGDGIFSIEIAASRSKGIIVPLLQAFERVQESASVKVLMLSGIEHCFVRGGRDEYNEAIERKLFHRLISFAWPVVAVLHGDVVGAGFLAAALCDFMVCNEDAHYGYTDEENQFIPTAAETLLFSERFGEVRAHHFLYASTYPTGSQLRAEGWTCPILPCAQVETRAQQLALTLATKSRDSLRLLKEHLTRHLVDRVKALTAVEVVTTATVEQPSAEQVLIIRYGKDGVKDLGADRAPCHKAIVLVSEDPDIPEDIVSDLQRLILESEIPVVAALTGNARGNSWLVSQLCDASVHSKTGVYSSTSIEQSLAQTAVAVFAHRFGSDAANEILLTGADYSGVELQQRVGALSVVEHDQVVPTAVRLAESWARMPRATLAAWKKQTATTLQDKVRNLPSAAGWEQKDVTLLAASEPITLQSRVVTASVHPKGIVVVKMADRNAKNMFSDALVEGVREAFAHIEQRSTYKVVILTGYDSYFASGGTKESLLAIQEGRVKFTDFKIFQLALDCRLPVIAAMQGHGLGAGWSMGMFADIVLLSEESRYVSPYMNYGFTPGAGATYSLPDKLGADLARESLLTAQQYVGHELKDRGATIRILPRGDVLAAAMALAEQIAQVSRGRLIGLKQQLTAHTHLALEETYQLELAMHEKTIVGRSDTLERIEKNFYQGIEELSVGTTQFQAVSPSASVSNNEDLPAVKATLRTLLASELQISDSDLDENAQFVDLGLDSITGVSWIRKINQKYRTSIEATKVYSYPTLTQLSRHVSDEAEKQSTLPSQTRIPPIDIPVAPASLPQKIAARPATERLISRRSRTASRLTSGGIAALPVDPIAVIGMAGQFPQAKNLDEFWRNIAQGRNCITQVPRDRWDVNAYYQPGDAVEGKTNSQWMGALEEYDLFDPLFFNISPTEAESMDPQQRLFLQACWHSIENAGYDAQGLSGSRCGVFVGCGAGDYHQLSRRNQLSAQGFTGNAASILAARISYWLNLHGPCLSIDTACSSSLVAIAQACDSLNSGVSDLALAGGVYVMAGPEMHIKTAQAGMLSAEGQCFAFDQRADGFVPGEGVGVVMLKRLADARRDQDIIYGVIQGWGINQDGKTNGITAPNPESQTRLEGEVYEKYRIDPASIQLIEAHGTGTKLGDPIEVEGLKKAFAKHTQKKEYCALGSVKSNIGHCLTAAGIAGVIKLLLALKHRQLPPTINFERLNEHIDLKDSPFYVNTRLQEWKLNGAARRQAAISSFGFSGTNAHLVVGEYLQPVIVPPVLGASQDTKSVIPLSARTAEQLRQKARDLLDFIRREEPSPDLAEIAWGLQMGRVAMDERLGFVVSSVGELTEKLQAWVNGELRIEDAYQGQVKRNKESLSVILQDDEMKDAFVDKWMAEGKLDKLLNLWVKGLELNWSRFYGAARPRRISLPNYPFAKERYWIETAEDGHVAPDGVAVGVRHPLLHRNTSDLSERRYSSTFTGDEFFLADHRLRTDGRIQKILPGVAYLEMAQAAIKQTWPMQLEYSTLELHGTVWLNPVVVERHEEISIALFATDDDRIDYEIYSTRAGQRTLHCQGQAAFSHRSTPPRLDIEQLRRQMLHGRLEATGIYSMFASMGLHYGPAHQGITAIHLGATQLLAELRLPAVIEASRQDYVLHPSLMDSALQASIGLIVDRNRVPDKPAVPFALESLRIVSTCTTEMVAWVRYADGSRPGDVKLDIDLCDGQGNVCVQMRGFALRVMGSGVNAASHVIRDEPRLFLRKDASFDGVFYERLIADVLNGDVSVEEAATLG